MRIGQTCRLSVVAVGCCLVTFAAHASPAGPKNNLNQYTGPGSKPSPQKPMK